MTSRCLITYKNRASIVNISDVCFKLLTWPARGRFLLNHRQKHLKVFYNYCFLVITSLRIVEVTSVLNPQYQQFIKLNC